MVRRLIPLVVLWVAAGVYVFLQIDAGWIPHDEGTLAHSAERVLSGQLPHRDFDDVYSGGLTFLNALAFRLLGVNLLSPRIVLFLFFLAWLPSLYFVASRFTRPVGAAATVLLAVAWSVPNYPAAVPSWYNLFFAVSGTASLARYLDTDRRSWLFVTGYVPDYRLCSRSLACTSSPACSCSSPFTSRWVQRAEVPTPSHRVAQG